MKTLWCLLASMAVLVAGVESARGGGFEISDQGPRSAGRAGAFAVKADDVSAVEYNPAGLARVRGTRLLLSNRFTHANEEYRRARTLDWSDAVHGSALLVDFPHVTNQLSNQFLGTMIGVATDFGLKDWGFALAVYGPPGLPAQRFPADGPQKYMLVDRNVIILYYTASVAWKHQDKFGVGVSAQWVDVPSMQFNLVVDGNSTAGIVNPVSSRFDVENRINGSDRFNLTGILGAWYKPLPCLELAFSGRLIPIHLSADSHLGVNPINLELTEPPAITRDGVPDDRVTFSFNLPVKLRLGARYVFERQGVEHGDLELDLGYESWSMVDAFTLDATGVVTEVLGQSIPINTIRMPRNWKDTWSVRLGGDWNVLPERLSLRGGFLYETPAVPSGYEYIDVMSFHRFGPSTGFTLSFVGFDLSAAYTYVFQMPVTVTEAQSRVSQQVPASQCAAPYTDPATCNSHYLGRPAAPANAGTYLSDYHFLNLGLQYHF